MLVIERLFVHLCFGIDDGSLKLREWKRNVSMREVQHHLLSQPLILPERQDWTSGVPSLHRC